MNEREQGFLLLGSSLGDPDRHPLTSAQLRDLTQRMKRMDPPTQARALQPRDLTALGYRTEMAERIVGLLEDGDLLRRYLGEAKESGCTAVTRVSPGYPVLLRKRLGAQSPGCLWVKGDVSLLQRPAISLVGSRELADKNREFARKAGQQAARQGFVLVSGNARGADQEAQNACLAAGGCVISVVADELAKQKTQDRMLYVSEDSFDEAFSSQRAISRNRVIHALGWRTLVAQVTAGRGGTWDGSVKNLRQNWSPLFCFDDGSEDARVLMNMGAQPASIQMLEDFSLLKSQTLSFFDQ